MRYIIVLILPIAIQVLLIKISRKKEDKRAPVSDDVKEHLGDTIPGHITFIRTKGIDPSYFYVLWYIVFPIVVGILLWLVWIGQASIGPLLLWLGLSYIHWEWGRVSLPQAHFGIGYKDRQRTGRIYLEGMHPLIPFLENVIVIDMELETKPITACVTTRDGLDVDFKGSWQFRPTYWITDRNGLNRYIEMDIGTILRGTGDAIEQELSIIAGANDGVHLYQARAVISLIINAVLSLKELPHRAKVWSDPDENYHIDIPIPKSTKEEKKFRKQLKAKFNPEGDLPEKLSDLPDDVDIPPELRIDFYRRNQEKIEDRISGEKSKKSVSIVEARYGVESITFAFATVSFSLATRQAQEAKTQADFFNEAVRHFRTQKAKDPVASALAFFGKAKQLNFNFQGLDLGDLGSAIGKVLAGAVSEDGDK